MGSILLLGVLFLAGEDNSTRQLDRLGLKGLPKSAKVEEIESQRPSSAPVGEREKYLVVVDEAAAKKAGIDPGALKEALRRAMDARSDRKEDGEVRIELGGRQRPPNAIGPPPVDEAGNPEAQGEKRLVGVIKKRDKPSDSYTAGAEARQETQNEDGSWLTVKVSGACSQQNTGLLKEVKIPYPFAAALRTMTVLA